MRNMHLSAVVGSLLLIILLIPGVVSQTGNAADVQRITTDTSTTGIEHEDIGNRARVAVTTDTASGKPREIVVVGSKVKDVVRELNIDRRLKDRLTNLGDDRLQAIRELDEEELDRLRQFRETDFDKLSRLRPTDVGKLTRLGEDALERVRQLDEDQIEKLARIKEDRLRRLSELRQEQLERVSDRLSEEQLERIAKLREDQLLTLTQLDDTLLRRLANLDLRRLGNVTAALASGYLKVGDIKGETLDAMSELNPEELRRLAQLDDAGRQRVLASLHRASDARVRFLNLRENFHDARSRLADSLDAFRERRDALTDAVQAHRNANATDKPERKEQVLRHAQRVLLHYVNVLIDHLESLKEKGYEPTNYEELSLNFASIKERLEEEELGEDALKEIAEELHGLRTSLNEDYKTHLARILLQRIDNLIEKLKRTQEKLEQLKERLENAGSSTERLENALAQLAENITTLEGLNEELETALVEADSPERAREALQKIKAIAKRAHLKGEHVKKIIRYLIYAHNHIRDGEPVDRPDVERFEAERVKERAEAEVEERDLGDEGHKDWINLLSVSVAENGAEFEDSWRESP